MFVLALSY